jgi:uncharacterized protein (DUF4415 family)
LTKPKKPDSIAAKDWDSVDSPPLTDRQLANLKPMRETFPDLVEHATERKRGQRGAKGADHI